MNKIRIAPSILSGDFAAMGKTVEDVNAWGADLVHVDVMDGQFVPNLTFGMPMVSAIKSHSNIPLDVHLMIVQPERYVEQFVKSGADIVTFHSQATEKTAECIKMIHDLGAKAGLVINPDVSINAVLPYINDIDIIVLMGVFPGFGGQKYNKCVDDKIVALRKIIDNSGRDIMLELDGGVTEENIDDFIAMGIDTVVGGTAVFKSKDPVKTIKRLRGQIV